MRHRPYLALVRNGFVQSAAYKSYSVSILVSGLLTLVLYRAIWGAVVAQGVVTQSLSEIMTYVVLAFALNQAIDAVSEWYIGSKVRDGTIVNEFKRPVSLRTHAYCYMVGSDVFSSVARGLPLLVVGALVYEVQVPQAERLLAVAASVVLSFHLAFVLSYTVALGTFWTKVPWSLHGLRMHMGRLFSGVLFPLSLLPEYLRPVFAALPFHAIIDTPVSIYLGRAPMSTVPHLLAEQLAWTLVLLVASELVWRRARQKITIHGG
jgi:ABC-2 type transport system permease protein